MEPDDHIVRQTLNLREGSENLANVPPNPYEIIHNMNENRYELRAYGHDEAIISGPTATEVAQVAEVSGFDVRLIAGRTAGEDIVATARDVDMKHRGMNPPATESRTDDPGAHFELDALAVDLETGAVIDATPEAVAEAGPKIEPPKIDEIIAGGSSDELTKANEEWLAAYQAREKIMKDLDKLMFGDDKEALADSLQQYRIASEALQAAEEKLGGPALDAAWARELRNMPPDDEPPEAELVDKPEPKPNSGPSSEALEEPTLTSEPAIPMPTEHVTTGTDQAQELREEAQTRYENRIANGMTPQDAANYDLAHQAAIDRGSFHPPGSSMWNLDIQHNTQVNLRAMAARQGSALDVKEAERTLEPVKGVEKKAKLGRVLKRPH